jgi:formylglycine-generating enzyme required for sulfatase activity
VKARVSMILGVVALSLGASASRASAGLVLFRNGFESGDTCPWSVTEPTVVCDAEMVFVPGGEFTMGSDTGGADERPVHQVDLDDFWIDRKEVTVDAYAACVTATGCTAPRYSSTEWEGCNWGATYDPADHPINCVSWVQAQAYCAWKGKRVPTEAEWEKAARGSDGRPYAWGDEPATCDFAVMSQSSAGGPGCGLQHTAPTGLNVAGESPYGAFDMDGNVWEWVNDWYDPSYYSVSPTTRPQGPPSSPLGLRSLRGGSWGNSDPSYLRTTVRYDGDPKLPNKYVGFRCAR